MESGDIERSWSSVGGGAVDGARGRVEGGGGGGAGRGVGWVVGRVN
jgi:hypothetical protein